MEVKLGKPMLEDVGETGIRAAWGGQAPTPEMPASGEYHKEWIDVVVGVELDPWPDRDWLTFWRDEDLDRPDWFKEPVLDGRKLIFEAPEKALQAAWDAVKARVAATNRAYREFSADEDADRGDPKMLAPLREAAQRRIDELT